MNFLEFWNNEQKDLKHAQFISNNKEHFEFLALQIEENADLDEDVLSDKLGLHELDEDYIDALIYIYDCFDSEKDFCLDVDVDFPENELTEKFVKQIVVRGGKKKKRFSSDKKGHRVVLDPATGNPKEVKMSGEELRNRKRGQRKGALKRKAGAKMAGIKRKISGKKRKSLGLKGEKK